MIRIHRNYCLRSGDRKGTRTVHAHVAVNPVGELEVDIEETKQHFCTNFDALEFDRKPDLTQIKGVEENSTSAINWQVSLSHRDANELGRLIHDAQEEYETLMRDL